MRVLMFGWEFPPQISGGLGVACEGLVRGLLSSGAGVVARPPAPPVPKADRGASASSESLDPAARRRRGAAGRGAAVETVRLHSDPRDARYSGRT